MGLDMAPIHSKQILIPPRIINKGHEWIWLLKRGFPKPKAKRHQPNRINAKYKDYTEACFRNYNGLGPFCYGWRPAAITSQETNVRQIYSYIAV